MTAGDGAGSAQSSCGGKAEPGNGSAEQPEGEWEGFSWREGRISSAGSGRVGEVPLIGILLMEGSREELSVWDCGVKKMNGCSL